ncbi:MAG TPA: MmgE/PrpD family protein [Xanthobacteraceae bacterium]|jgi:2-methylcitrate dehydratase PrpD|nr:MmgE/PrpD family protein [Xanthobacteraceae bacterium]
MQTLSDYMAAAASRPLPDEAAEHAKHHLLDTLASIVSGSELLPGQAAQRYIGAHGGKGAATIAGTKLTAAPADAALANGVMAHADETDDSHNASRSHPGCAVVPAALAVGEELGIDGARFLRAVTLGYDVGTRVVMAMGGAEFSYESSLATHSIAGTFCAAAAAACAAGLNARQMRWALDYTAQQSSGIVAWRRDTDHIEKAFVFGGMTARNGVTAALVVRSGWNGVEDIFSGADNFFQAYAPKAKPERLVEKLGERYEVVQTDIKKWTVGSPIQGPLDAIEAIRSKRRFESDQVRRVTVRLAPSVAAVVDNRDIPDICLQHMVAVMLVDNTVSFHAAHDKPRMQDAATLRERAKVDLVRDGELVQFLPVRIAVVEIELADGTRLSERISAVRGTPRNPMSRTEVMEKARDLTAPILGREKSARLIDTVYAIETVTDIRNLQPLLQRE